LEADPRLHFGLSHPKEKVGWPWAKGAPQFLRFSYNISATAGANNFKFGMQLGFAKADNKITHIRKGGHGPGLGEFPKFGVPLQYLHNG